MTATQPQFNPASPRDLCTTQISTGTTGQSDAVDIFGHTLTSIQFSTGWDAASATFLVSLDGTTYQSLYCSSGEYTLTGAGASVTMLVAPADFVGFRKLKIRSGTAGSAVAQSATRTLTFGLTSIFDG